MTEPGELLGRGRSGTVYRDVDARGCPIARKVFGAAGLNKVVQSALLGAPNPYAWNTHAIKCALLRRQIVADLVQYWFGGELRVARAFRRGWCARTRSYALETEFVRGRHVQLRHPLNGHQPSEHAILLHNFMRPLQRHLTEAGLDGLVWQAGLGNPVALGNFMRDLDSKGWVWIDLESGIPALAPLDARQLFNFYLPASIRHGGPLFDDVDVAKLRRYVAEHQTGLQAGLGTCGYKDLVQRLVALQTSQLAWKSQPRVLRSLLWSATRGRVTPAEVQWYAKRPIRWYLRLAGRVVHEVAVRCAKWPSGLIRWLRRIPFLGLLVGLFRALSVETYRLQKAQDYVRGRIERWRSRRQLTAFEAEELSERLEEGDTATFLGDFGVHLGLKPVVKALEYWVLPLLFAAQLIDASTLAIALLIGGSVARTAYTLWRIGRAANTGRERPWIALLVGMLPVAGNLAYPVQMTYSEAEATQLTARFIIYDVITLMGRKIPIWGGRDTGSEHLFNRIAQQLMRALAGEAPPAAVAAER